jgi:putative ABC transport system permease protein
MDASMKDLRYSLRMMARRPGFTIVSGLTLMIGIGASTTIFGVVHSVLLKRLPYRDVAGIVTVWQHNRGGGVERDRVSPANFLDYRQLNQSFEAIAAAEPFGFDLVGSGEPESFSVWRVSDGFFDILGVNAVHGRTLVSEEYQEGHDKVRAPRHTVPRTSPSGVD